MNDIALAFPKHEEDRAKLRALLPPNSVPMPAIYEDGEDRPCPHCGVILNVGPRVAASGLPVYCFQFVMAVTILAGPLKPVSLGNPKGKPEDVVGYEACWKDHGERGHCRKPKGHKDDCAPF